MVLSSLTPIYRLGSAWYKSGGDIDQWYSVRNKKGRPFLHRQKTIDQLIELVVYHQVSEVAQKEWKRTHNGDCSKRMEKNT